MAGDVAEMIRAMREQMDEAERLHAQGWARIWVTDYAPPGSMLDVPYLEDDGRETGLRQLLVHPNDWTEIEALARPTDFRLLEAWGIPIVKDREL